MSADAARWGRVAVAGRGDLGGGRAPTRQVRAEQRGREQRVQLEVVADAADGDAETGATGAVQHDRRLVVEDAQQVVQPRRRVDALAGGLDGGGEAVTVGHHGAYVLALCRVEHRLHPRVREGPRLHQPGGVGLGQPVPVGVADEALHRELDPGAVLGEGRPSVRRVVRPLETHRLFHDVDRAPGQGGQHHGRVGGVVDHAAGRPGELTAHPEGDPFEDRRQLLDRRRNLAGPCLPGGGRDVPDRGPELFVVVGPGGGHQPVDRPSKSFRNIRAS